MAAKTPSCVQSTNGAQTLSRFCLFAVLYFIVILVVYFFLVVRTKMQNEDMVEKLILKHTAEEWFEWNGDLYDQTNLVKRFIQCIKLSFIFLYRFILIIVDDSLSWQQQEKYFSKCEEALFYKFNSNGCILSEEILLLT